METLKEKQLRVLNETASAYTKATLSKKNRSCLYYTEGTQGCAVGRLIADKELCKRLDATRDENGKEVGSTNAIGVFDRLPSDVQELGVDFLMAIQGLHDDMSDGNWDENGLTEIGLNEVKAIKYKFKL